LAIYNILKYVISRFLTCVEGTEKLVCYIEVLLYLHLIVMVIDNTNQNFNNFGEKKRRAYNNKGPLGT
jgi:hypothetical protein